MKDTLRLGFLLALMGWFNFSTAQFVENKGQIYDAEGNLHPEVRFTYQLGDAEVFFLENKVVYAIKNVHREVLDGHEAGSKIYDSLFREMTYDVNRVDLEFEGCNTDIELFGEGKASYATNFYHSDFVNVQEVPVYQQLTYKGVYDNIDFVFYPNEEGLKYDIVLHEGADIKDVSLYYNGAENVYLQEDNLVIATEFLDMKEGIPYSYKDGDKGAEVKVNYSIHKNRIQFETEQDYNALVIDPSLTWCTYFESTVTTFGGLDYEYIEADASGNLFLIGTDNKGGFPIVDPGGSAYSQAYSSGAELYIAKFDNSRQLVWATNIGGNSSDYVYGTDPMAIDNGMLHLVGYSNNTWPLVNGSGYYNAVDDPNYYVRFDVATGELVHSTFIGGHSSSSPSIDISSSGKVVIGMEAYSFGPGPLQTFSGGYNQTVNGGFVDYFFIELNSSYNLIWGTFLGGAGSVGGVNVRYDDNDNIFFVGEASFFSAGTGSELMTNPGGGAYFDNTTSSEDMSIGKFDSNRDLVWHTMYGGDTGDEGTDAEMGNGSFITIDPSTDEVIITAGSSSTDSPTMALAGAYNQTTAPANAGTSTGFSGFNSLILKFSNSGVRNWATYWGDDASGDLLYGSVIVSCNKMIFFGRSWSMTAISATGHYNNSSGGQAFLWEVDRSTYSPDWSSYFGTSSTSEPHMAYVDGTNRLFMAQGTYDAALPVTDPGGGAYYDGTHGTGGSNSFVIWELNIVPSPSVTADQSVCSGTSVTLTASGGSGAPYNWYTSASGGSPIHTGASYTTPALTSTTTYYVSSGSGICLSDRSPTTITVTPGPSAPTISSNSPVCVGSAINLTANTVGGATYSWTGPNSFTSSSEDPTIASATAAAGGTYSCTVTVGGCTSSAATTSVSVNTNSVAPTGITGTATICNGQSTTLTLSGGSAGTGATAEWYSGSCGGTSVGSGNSITVSPSSNTTYFVRYEGTCNTTTCASQLVTVNAIPSAPTLSSNSPVCEGDDINLTANTVGGATYAWTGPNSFTSSTEDPTISGATTAADGTYSCTVTVAGCTSSAGTTDVTVNTTPSAPTAGGNTPICDGDDINLTASTVGGATYSWTGPNSFTSSSQNPTISGATTAADGTYNVTATVAGCTSTAGSVAITVNTIPAAPTLGSNSPVCENGTINLTANTIGGATYAWTGPNSFTSSSEDPSIGSATTAMDGTYSCAVTVAGCTSTAATTDVTINTLDDASFSYASGTYCLTGTDPTPTITGLAGGTFSIDNSGVIIAGTGEVDLDANGVTSYTVTYTTAGACPNSSTQNLSVTSAPDATFSYTGTPYCADAGTATVTFGAGASGGVFSSTAGLSINTSSGEVDLAASTPGTYMVSNDIAAAGGCAAANASTSIEIVAVDDPTFAYGSSTYCLSGTDPTPTITTSGGSFASTPAGLTLNGTTGEITLASSAANTYDVTYITGGACPDNSTVQVTVTTSPTAGFSYAGTPYCEGSGAATVTFDPGASAGTFAAVPSTTDLVINATTGEVDLNTSVPGTYTVENDIPAAGGCVAANETTTITITAQDDPTFDYGGATSFCENETNPVATISGTAGGTFTSTPAGIAVDGSTGEIDISTSTAGASYDITYTTTGTCPDNSTLTVTLNESPTAPTGGSTAASNTICEGESVDITAAGSTGTGVTYSVFDAMTGGTNLGATPLTVSPTTTTTYYVEAFNSNGCGNLGGRDAVTITVNPLPSIDAGADETICPGESVTLTATGTGSVVWSTTETTPSITVSPSATTVYTVTLTDGNSCENSDDVTVTVQSVGGSLSAVDDSYTSNSGVVETLDVMSNDTQTSSTPAIVSAPSNGTATVNGDGTIEYTSNDDFIGTEAFTYEICDAFCTNICDTATVTITVESSEDFKVPGGFSPNGDNINDFFVITGLDQYPDNKLSIFNRWGDVVYEAAPYNNDWDGTPSVGVLMGDKVTSGTYFYILELGEGIEPLKGSLEIKRD